MKVDEQIVILDNGGYTAKVGMSTGAPVVVPNCIMKAKSERRRPFIGNQIEECRDISGLYFILPFQKGYVVNWDVQKTVWDYIFSKECCPVNLSQSAVIFTEPPFNFPTNQEAAAEIFFEEYEVSSLLKVNPATLSCYNYRRSQNKSSKCCIIVDCGYSFCHIIPFVNDIKVKAAIRRIDVGGKLLTNHLKEILSYRQLHVMDETYVVNQVKEDACFVSHQFVKDMEKTKLKLDKNNIVKDYVLPDFTTIRRGYLTDVGAAGDQQTLRLNNERFAVPEILFHPSDVGINQMGVPEAIMDCLRDCPEESWPHLLSNIVLTGGSINFEGFKKRVYNEVRALADADFPVNVCTPTDTITYAFEGGRLLAKDEEFMNLRVTRSDYEEQGSPAIYDKFNI